MGALDSDVSSWEEQRAFSSERRDTEEGAAREAEQNTAAVPVHSTFYFSGQGIKLFR